MNLLISDPGGILIDPFNRTDAGGLVRELLNGIFRSAS